jgi:hypothetical protein
VNRSADYRPPSNASSFRTRGAEPPHTLEPDYPEPDSDGLTADLTVSEDDENGSELSGSFDPWVDQTGGPI